MRQILSSYRYAPLFKFGSRAIGQRVTNLIPVRLVAMTAVMIVCSGNFNDVLGQVQERSRLLLRDVAKVTLDSTGQSQIAFNPAICRRLGPELCEYFRAHEYGHVNLRHLERGTPTQQAEREADMWAARNASPAAVAAAKQYFSRGNGGSRYHGSGQQRAQRLNVTQTGRQVSVANRSTPQAASVNRRAPTRYAGGSKTTTVRRPVASCTGGSVRQVVYIRSSTSDTARSYAPQGYVPQGGFNNRR